jgi:hypothetical protein
MISWLFDFNRPDGELLWRGVLAVFLLACSIVVGSGWLWRGNLIGRTMTDHERRFASISGVVFSISLTAASVTSFSDRILLTTPIEWAVSVMFVVHILGTALIGLPRHLRDRRVSGP